MRETQPWSNKIYQNLSLAIGIMFSKRDLLEVFVGVFGVLSARPHAWLRVSGPDAAAFLQGQCTQDLRGLKDGQLAWTLWLSIKGKVLGESLVLREVGDGGGADAEVVWWIWSPHTDAETLRARLEEFIIADDVTVENAGAGGGWTQRTLAGEVAEAWLQAALGAEPPAAGAWARLDGGYVFAGRRGVPRVWEWLAPTTAGLGVPDLSELRPEALTRARIAAGVPAIPTEFGPSDLPQEAGLEEMAVSFNKGCYLGQEVMARLHAMGQVRRRLLRVAGDGVAPAAGEILTHAAEGKRAGELRAAVDDGRGGWIGLAMINLLGLGPGGVLLIGGTRPVAILDTEILPA